MKRDQGRLRGSVSPAEQPRIGIKAFAGVALSLLGAGEAEDLAKSLTIGRVGGGFDQAAIRRGDQFDRAKLVLLQIVPLCAGRLVPSSLRSNSADTAYARLIDLGVEPFVVKDLLR